MAHFHAVRFYNDADSLARHVAAFILDGFSQDRPAVIIATPPHRARILTHLRTQGIDIIRSQIDGELMLLDAVTLLAGFMLEGMPDVPRFRVLMTSIVERANGGNPARAVRVYGEMVDVLWKAGLTTATLRLELLWNQLAEHSKFELLCGYAARDAAQTSEYHRICALHSDVLTESTASPLVH
jgi:hypothetical protein